MSCAGGFCLNLLNSVVFVAVVGLISSSFLFGLGWFCFPFCLKSDVVWLLYGFVIFLLYMIWHCLHFSGSRNLSCNWC